MTTKYTEPIRIRFDKDLYEQIKQLAEDDDRTMASFIRQLARQAVRQRE